MCEVKQGPLTGARPRWGRLYAILPLALVAFLLVDGHVSSSAERGALAYAIAAGVWGAMVWWVRSNRAALDRVEWCACASETVRVRVVRSAAADVPLRVGEVIPAARAPRPIDREPVHAGVGERGADLALIGQDHRLL
jgi:hypothetical protein